MLRNFEQDLFGGTVHNRGINSKIKGNKNELMAGKWLSRWTGLEFNRVPMSGGLRWQNSQGVAGDLVCGDPTFPFVIETKHYKNIALKGKLRKNSFVYTAFKQAKRDSVRVKKLPLLLLRSNNMKSGVFVVFFQEKEAKNIPFSIPCQAISQPNSKIQVVGFLSSILERDLNYSIFVKNILK